MPQHATWAAQINGRIKSHPISRDIVILPDSDEPGCKHAKLVATRLNGTAKRIRILELPGLTPKGELAAGGTCHELLRLAEAAPDYSGGADNKERPDTLTDDDFEREIRRLTALPKTRYERERTSAASALNISPSRLEKLIAAERKGGGPQLQGRPLEFSEPEPWLEPVDGAALLPEITAAIKTYVILSEPQAHIVALWILHAYVFDLFQCSPRLTITSPEKGCGKTTLMDVGSYRVQSQLRASPRPQYSG